jgi:hypothetical protein
MKSHFNYLRGIYLLTVAGSYFHMHLCGAEEEVLAIYLWVMLNSAPGALVQHTKNINKA